MLKRSAPVMYPATDSSKLIVLFALVFHSCFFATTISLQHTMRTQQLEPFEMMLALVTCASLYAVAHRTNFALFCRLGISTVRYEGTPSFCLSLRTSARSLLSTQISRCFHRKNLHEPSRNFARRGMYASFRDMYASF